MRAHGMIKKVAVYIGLAVITVLTLFPILWGLSSSFRSDTELFQYAKPLSMHTFIPLHVTGDAYIKIFSEFNFQKPIINTMIVSLISIFLGCLINSVAAFGFACFKFKGKNIIFSIVLVSFMVPFESIALPLYSIVDKLHWVDTFTGIIVPGIADGLVLFLFTQFFKELPISLIEAARVDGANLPTIFIKIIIPMSVPVFVTAGLMIFMNQWNAYLWPLVIGRSPDVRLIQIALASFQQERVTLWSCLYAASMVSALIPLVMFLPLQKYYVQGITSSGIKG